MTPCDVNVLLTILFLGALALLLDLAFESVEKSNDDRRVRK